MKLTIKGAAGILAAGAAAGLMLLGGEGKQPVEEQLVIRQEITSLRKANVKVFATNRADTRVARVYARPVHYRDKQTGELKEYDLTERRTGDQRAVFIGNNAVERKAGNERDYRFTHESGRYVAYTYTGDTTQVTAQTEFTKTGVKQTWILGREANPRLQWTVKTDAVMTESGGGLVFSDGEGEVLFRTTAPVAWDAEGKPVAVRVTVEGDALLYDVDKEGAAFPVTVDPSTTVESYGDDGAVSSENADYLTARNATTGTSISTAYYLNIGQNKGTYYAVYRSVLNFPIADQNIATVLSESLYIKIYNDQSKADFDFFPVQGTYTGAPSTGWFNDFLGWETSGTYSTNTMSNYFDTSIGSWASQTWKYVPFTAAGRDTTQAVWARGDTLRLMLISANDNSATAPDSAITEYVYFYNSNNAGKEPYLSITYTVAVPTGFTMTSSGTDSVYCEWDNNIAGEDSFRIKDAVTSAYIGSVEADETSFSIGGLIPNTVYDWLVEVVGGTADGQQSAADSVCTDAAAPAAAPDTSDVTYTSMTVKPDTAGTGNTSDTDYAIVFITTDGDTSYVDASADPDTLKASLGVEDDWGWRTYDEWGAASGTSVTGLDPARTYSVGVMARRRDFPE